MDSYLIIAIMVKCLVIMLRLYFSRGSLSGFIFLGVSKWIHIYRGL